MILRDKRNLGKRVRYLPPHPRCGKTAKVTGFRGDWGKTGRHIVPYVTLSDGNSVPGFVLYIKKEG